MTSGQRVWKGQPVGPVERVRHHALDLREPLAAGRVELRHRAQQRPRVRVLRRFEERVDVRRLDHLAEIHDRDLVGDFRDDAEIVGDQHHGDAELVLDLA